MKNTRVVLYARVSTKEQNSETQLRELRDYCKDEGYNLCDEYIDNGVSGGTGDRKEFLRLLADADRKRFDLVVIWSLDRLSREGISNTLGYIKRLRKANVALESLQEKWLDPSDDKIGELILSIFAWVAEQERIRIATRVKAGRDRARAEGKHMGRPKGSKDKKRRRRSGYHLRWAKKTPPKKSKKLQGTMA
nr:hypothetical protein 16 [bacterium]